MRYAIVSDIHANAQAWEAVLKDIRKIGVDGIVCLGDVVGYGPSPGPVMESVHENTEVIVLGNHEAVIGGRLDADCFSDHARLVIDWTRDQLTDKAVSYFAELPDALEVEGFVIAHAAAANPEQFDYIENVELALPSFNECEQQIIFIGHTHNPAIFSLNTDDGTMHSHLPLDFSPLDNFRYIVNAGSVGDPRDNDFRASYCLFDAERRKVYFRKVPFDIQGYQADLAASGLDIHPYFLSSLSGSGYDKSRDWRPQKAMQIAASSKQPRIQVNRGMMKSIMESRQTAQPTAHEPQHHELTEEEKAARVQKAMARIEEEKQKKLEQMQRQQQAAGAQRQRNQQAAEIARQRQEQEDIVAKQQMDLRKIEAKKKLDAAAAKADERRKQEADRQAQMKWMIDQKRSGVQARPVSPLQTQEPQHRALTPEEEQRKLEQAQRQQQAAAVHRQHNQQTAETARQHQEQEDIIAKQQMDLRKIEAKKKLDAAAAKADEKRKQEADRQAQMRWMIEQKKLAAQRAREAGQSGAH